MTLHRALGFVDRAASPDGGPLRVVMATEGRKRDNIDLRMSGAKLERLRANPVLGYGHSYWGRANLPIGRIDDIAVEGVSLLGELAFDQADEFAREVERKIRDGFMSAVSIGFDVLKWEGGAGDSWRGGVAEEWEPTELSVVPVPLDADALVASGRSVDPDLVGLLRVLLERLDPPGADVVPQHPEPAASAGFSVPEASARALLAAFNLEGIR